MLRPRRWFSPTWSRTPWSRLLSSSPASPTPGVEGVRACVAAMLSQQLAMLEALDDRQYVFHSELVQASIGGHTRHSLDHLRKPLETWFTSLDDHTATMIRYDLRARATLVETDRHAAMDQIRAIQKNLDAIDTDALNARVGAAFMLSGDGHEFVFDSTLSRELAFAVHHCIHHNALVKILLRSHFPEVPVPPCYGMAPSTLNFQSTHTSSST